MMILIAFLFLLPLGHLQAQQQFPVPEDTLARWMLCDTKLPLYSGKGSKPVWLDSQQLKSRATHCEAPKPLQLAQRVRVNGKVLIAILVNQAGETECLKVISGHPLLVESAVEAAKGWKFKPIKLDGKAVGFCGLLEFHFVTGSADHAPDSCLCIHW